MNTTLKQTLCLSPLFCVVFFMSLAYNAHGQETGDVQSSESSTTAQVTPAAAVPEKWFKSDMVTGNDAAVGDFVTGPGMIEVTVKPGQTVTKIMTVTNRISDNRAFELAVEDMSGSVDPSIPVVLLGDKSGPYTLKEFISFPARKFDLKLGERAQIPVTITMPPNAEPGGYYGAVLVSTVQNDNKTEDNTIANSPIVARIGTLFFITVPGAAEHDGALTDFSTVPDKSIYTKGPIKLGLLYENKGSIHQNPYGEIRIQNIFGEEVGFLELDPWFVLPKAMRLREVSWDRELLLGRYTITAKINRGYDDIIDEKVIHIWVLPWQVVGGAFAIIFTLFLLIKFVFSRFEFKRKV